MSKNRRAKSAPAEHPHAPTAASRFARWYRGRPLIGGALIVVAGLEIFFSGQLDFGSIHIQVGIEGMQAMILPFALVTLGVLIIAMPAHRLFYGVMSLAISIYAVVGVNLGGFLIGTLLGIVGGIMCVSWTPRNATSADSPEPAADSTAPRSRRRSGGAAIVIAGLILCGWAAGIPSSPSFADTPAASQEPAPPGDSTSPTPAPTTDPTPAPSPTSDPTPDPAPASTADPTPESTTPGATSHAAPQPAPVRDPGAPLAATQSARLLSTSVTLNGAHYLGTVTVALADGSTPTVLKITADHVTLNGFVLKSTDAAARTSSIASSTVTLSGPVVIYCTSLTGTLAGGGVVTLDPANPPPPGTALPTLDGVTIDLVSVTSPSASLVGANESVR